ncbi:2-keto-4-pentenoate hydratase [Parerythrobacter lacustris]|uniref:2-keto-4-pentenoate hydratase n=1 Tax=Parerythrobacter lacustris TaxID=2969984 RepID=A0ABT1XNC1_9SPHN|nr:2-keto-4-pentenoate hydratase [Parerythrobacter lacustris]
MTVEAREIANAFVEARRSGAAIARYPGERPTDLETAYQIQDCALSLWNREIGGWKVGRINPPMDTILGTNRLAGPVFADLVHTASDAPARFKVFGGGFAAVEAEFMLRIAPVAASLPTNPQQAMMWIDEIRIGIEVASSPYAAINVDGPCVTVSDHGNNAGLLLGPVVPRELWPHLDEIGVSTDIDGLLVGEATTATMLDGPFGAVAFLLDNLRQRRIAPQAGWWISSGAITGVHEVAGGQSSAASFEGVGTVSVIIE